MPSMGQMPLNWHHIGTLGNRGGVFTRQHIRNIGHRGGQSFIRRYSEAFKGGFQKALTGPVNGVMNDFKRPLKGHKPP